MLVFISFIIIINLYAGSAWMQPKKIHVDNNSHHLVDDSGRVRIFHGINRVMKGPPYYPTELLNDTHVDNLAKWGFNVVRLGMMWSGVETSPFKYNTTYLDIMQKIVLKLQARNISVIFDMHQDVLSSRFGGYDGVPLWLINSFPKPEYPYPSPFTDIGSNWFLGYLTYAVGEAFRNIYRNESGAVDHLSGFWQTVAKRFGNFNNVLGYELINEPFPGNIWRDPKLLLPGTAGEKLLEPLYQQLAQSIRQVDDETLIFYEPVTYGMVFNGTWSGTGFDKVPGGDNYQNRSVLSFHYYCWVITKVDDQTPFAPWKRVICDDLFFPKVLKTVKADVSRTGGANFLTEFGKCQAGISKNTTEYQECLNIVTEADKSFTSWTYWDSIFYHPDGSIVTENIELFSRPYARAIAGEPLSSSFDPVHRVYTLSYLPFLSAQQPTVIYATPIQYPAGFSVSVCSQMTYRVHDNFVLVEYSNKIRQAEICLITISPK